MIPSHAPGVQFEQVGGEWFVSHPSGERFLVPNETAALIWSLCDGQHPVEDIESLLCAAYPENEAEIRQDVDRVLKELLELGFIVDRDAR